MTVGGIASAVARAMPRLMLVGAALACVIAAASAINFPALSGRVVDGANIIPADTRAALTTKLADLEAKSGIQLVVATVATLDGQEIEPYANQLFRAWQLGERTKNNGVLLLVAPKERRVRIEVGYGLEGTLTDALSKIIITNAITPRFKAGDFGGGIVRGVDDIITVLTTDSSEWQARPSLRLDSALTRSSVRDPANWLVWLGIAVFIMLCLIFPGFRWFAFNVALNILFSTATSRGSSSSSGGGFSGGGGSSGGGGASGNW